jgi:drug/metabolite transporter (DMT)-like permease
VGPVALSLVLLSAFGHALWNFLVKRSVDKLAFMWWVMVISGAFLTLLWLPFRPGWGTIPLEGWACLLGSGLAHAVYLTCLTRAYDEGDLSQVYPLIRSAPVFLVLWAVLLLGERFTVLGLAGIGVVLGGNFLLHLGDDSVKGLFAPLRSLSNRPSRLALTGALFLSFGSLIDKVGVGLVHPFLYAVLFIDIEALIFSHQVLRKRSLKALFVQWYSTKKRLLMAGVVGVPSYALVLVAMSMSQVSYVISARQISVVFGVLLGVWLLGERQGKIRLLASLFIFGGVVMIGLA